METTEKGKTKILLLGLILLLCTILALQALAKDQSEDRRKRTDTRWQHLSLTQIIGETPKSELAKSINKCGQEGWELVSVGNINELGTTTKTVFYFKKRL